MTAPTEKSSESGVDARVLRDMDAATEALGAAEGPHQGTEAARAYRRTHTNKG